MKTTISELVDAIKFLLPAIGKNESRRNLMNLYVEKKTNQIILTAANAFLIKRQVISEVVMDGEEGSKDCSFLIPGHVLKNYLYMLENYQLQNEESWHKIATITPSFLDIRNRESIQYEQPGYEYPNLDGLFSGESEIEPEPIENPNNIGLDPHLMGIVMSGFGEGDRVKMQIKSPSEPIVIKSHMGRKTAMILPIKIKW